MAAAGSACKGKYKKDVVGTLTSPVYCTHPKAKAYTCSYHCSHGLCPVEGEVVPKSEPEAKKATKAKKAKKGGK